MTGGTETLGWWLSPWVLGLLGLCVGSFLNVVAHRLPRMMERQWWADVAAQLVKKVRDQKPKTNKVNIPKHTKT